MLSRLGFISATNSSLVLNKTEDIFIYSEYNHTIWQYVKGVIDYDLDQ